MNKIKRERSANFTLHERDILVLLVLKHQTVLENKISNATTWKNKEAAWKSIHREFNARSRGIFRSVKTLKVKYEGLKRIIRKKAAEMGTKIYRSEGEDNIAPPLDNMEEHFKSILCRGSDNVESNNDSYELPETQSQEKYISNQNLLDELTVAKLDIIKLKKSFMEAEIAEKRHVWEFEENERKKESDFREKERKWKEEEHSLKLEKLRLELKVNNI